MNRTFMSKYQKGANAAETVADPPNFNSGPRPCSSSAQRSNLAYASAGRTAKGRASSTKFRRDCPPEEEEERRRRTTTTTRRRSPTKASPWMKVSATRRRNREDAPSQDDGPRMMMGSRRSGPQASGIMHQDQGQITTTLDLQIRTSLYLVRSYLHIEAGRKTITLPASPLLILEATRRQ